MGKFLKGESIKCGSNETSLKLSFTVETEDISTKDDENSGWATPAFLRMQWSATAESYSGSITIPSESKFSCTIGGGDAFVTSSEVSGGVDGYAVNSVTWTGNGDFATKRQQ